MSSGTFRRRTTSARPIETPKKFGSAPRRRRAPGHPPFDGTGEGLGGTPSRAPPPPPGPPSRTSTRRPPPSRCPGQPSTASPDCHVDPLQPLHQVQEPTRWTTPATYWSTCTPGTTSTDPTSMPEGHHGDDHQESLLEQPAPPGAPQGATRTRSRPAPPSKGALLRIERFDRVAAEVFRGLDEVVAGRVPMNSTPRSSTSPPCTPPTAVPGPPWRHGERRDPRRAPLTNAVFFPAPGARIPQIPIEGGVPRPSTGRGLPPNEPPSLCT